MYSNPRIDREVGNLEIYGNMRYRTTILDTIVGTFFVITIPILNNLLWKMAKLEIIYLQTCAIFYGDVNLPKVFFR